MSFNNKIKLGDAYSELSKSKFQVQQADNVGQYPFYTSGDKILTHSEYIVDDEIIFLATGGKANIKFNAGKSAYSTDTYAIKGKEHSSKYLYYLLLDKLSYIERNFFSGSGLKHLQKKDFRNWEVRFPNDTNEEELIVKFLSTLDKAIVATELLIAKYQRIKTGLLHDLLTCGIDEHGNLRSEKTHQFKNSPLGRIPVEWEVVPILSLIAKDSPICYGIVQVGKHFENGVPTIAIKDLNKDYKTDIHYSHPDIESPYERSRVNPGDILISIKATTGRIGIVPDFFKGNISRDLARIRFNSDCFPQFYKYFFESNLGQNTLDFITVGTTRKEISIAPLKTIEIISMNKEEQRKISNALMQVDQQISFIQINCKKLQSLKTGLMQDLLSGKVRVK